MLNAINCREKPKVKLVAMLQGRVNERRYDPDAIAAFGALGCFEERTPTQLFEERIDANEDKIIGESFGRGHGSVADQTAFAFEIENLTRCATLQLCLPQYLEHLQQSLRRANASRGFYLPAAIENCGIYNLAIETLTAAFDLYDEMSAGGVPGEDARFILPLYTRTNIQPKGNARELTHLHAMNEQGEVPSAVKEVVEGMIAEASNVAPLIFKRRGSNYETLAWLPSAQLYASTNRTMNRIIQSYKNPDRTVLVEAPLDLETLQRTIKERDEAELSVLKHSHNGGPIEGFLAPMSLAAYHQAIRQRTWDQAVESIYDAAGRKQCKTPPKIANSAYVQKYQDQMDRMFDLYWRLIEEGVGRSEAVGVLPHSLMVYDLIHVNGWNAIHSIGKRTCTQAQWEIRAIANEIAQIIKQRNSALGTIVGPQGDLYGKCPERKPCGTCKSISNPPERKPAA